LFFFPQIEILRQSGVLFRYKTMGRYPTILLFLLLLSGCLGVEPVEQAAPEIPESREEPPTTSLPAPNEQQIVEVKPAEEPAPPQIGYFEAARQISRLYPDGLTPLTVRGRLPIVLYDLDNDQHPECLSLGVPSDGLDGERMALLSDSSRLFHEDNQPVAFSLLVFANTRGNFRRLKILDLGDHSVFESVRITPLQADRPQPVIVTVSFQIVDGRETRLLVFDDAGGVPLYRLTLSETLSTQYRLEDIDGDGIIDLFVKEKAMEEGTGFETFLIWYRWNGREFAEYRSQNVVRNLNAFLASATELLLSGESGRIVRQLLEPTMVRSLRNKGWNDQRILVHVMGLEQVGLERFPVLREVVFPPFLEDPFTVHKQTGSCFDLTYRMIDTNGTSYITTSRLYMLANPFRDRQFAFSPAVD